jgi:glutaredoxin
MSLVSDEDIIFFRISVCPKCKVMEKVLEEVRRERSDVTVRMLNLFTNLGLARSLDQMTVPTLVVRGKTFRGITTKQEILSSLDD